MENRIKEDRNVNSKDNSLNQCNFSLTVVRSRRLQHNLVEKGFFNPLRRLVSKRCLGNNTRVEDSP